MQPTLKFSLSAASPGRPLEQHERRLVLDGTPTSTVVPGDEISAQYACGDVSLVITHFDHFEAVSHWCLAIDRDGAMLDRVSTPDYFGFIERIVVESPDSISFGFHGTAQRWQIQLHPAGFRSYARAELGLRWNRFLFRRRFLSLRIAHVATAVDD